MRKDSNAILLFGGKKLKLNYVLEEIGVEYGSFMNTMPISTITKKKKMHHRHHLLPAEVTMIIV